MAAFFNGGLLPFLLLCRSFGLMDFLVSRSTQGRLSLRVSQSVRYVLFYLFSEAILKRAV